MTPEVKVGDHVAYRRYCDGTLVRGVVESVIRRTDPTPMWSIFRLSAIRDEKVAYRLKLNPEDEARIGHPVTIGGSRVIPQEIVT